MLEFLREALRSSRVMVTVHIMVKSLVTLATIGMSKLIQFPTGSCSPGLNDVSHSACWVYLDGSVGSSVWGVTYSYGTLRIIIMTALRTIWTLMVTSTMFLIMMYGAIPAELSGPR